LNRPYGVARYGGTQFKQSELRDLTKRGRPKSPPASITAHDAQLKALPFRGNQVKVEILLCVIEDLNR